MRIALVIALLSVIVMACTAPGQASGSEDRILWRCSDPWPKTIGKQKIILRLSIEKKDAGTHVGRLRPLLWVDGEEKFLDRFKDGSIQMIDRTRDWWRESGDVDPYRLHGGEPVLATKRYAIRGADKTHPLERFLKDGKLKAGKVQNEALLPFDGYLLDCRGGHAPDSTAKFPEYPVVLRDGINVPDHVTVSELDVETSVDIVRDKYTSFSELVADTVAAIKNDNALRAELSRTFKSMSINGDVVSFDGDDIRVTNVTVVPADKAKSITKVETAKGRVCKPLAEHTYACPEPALSSVSIYVTGAAGPLLFNVASSDGPVTIDMATGIETGSGTPAAGADVASPVRFKIPGGYLVDGKAPPDGKGWIPTPEQRAVGYVAIQSKVLQSCQGRYELGRDVESFRLPCVNVRASSVALRRSRPEEDLVGCAPLSELPPLSWLCPKDAKILSWEGLGRGVDGQVETATVPSYVLRFRGKDKWDVYSAGPDGCFLENGSWTCFGVLPPKVRINLSRKIIGYLMVATTRVDADGKVGEIGDLSDDDLVTLPYIGAMPAGLTFDGAAPAQDATAISVRLKSALDGKVSVSSTVNPKCSGFASLIQHQSGVSVSSPDWNCANVTAPAPLLDVLTQSSQCRKGDVGGALCVKGDLDVGAGWEPLRIDGGTPGERALSIGMLVPKPRFDLEKALGTILGPCGRGEGPVSIDTLAYCKGGDCSPFRRPVSHRTLGAAGWSAPTLPDRIKLILKDPWRQEGLEVLLTETSLSADFRAKLLASKARPIRVEGQSDFTFRNDLFVYESAEKCRTDQQMFKIPFDRTIISSKSAPYCSYAKMKSNGQDVSDCVPGEVRDGGIVFNIVPLFAAKRSVVLIENAPFGLAAEEWVHRSLRTTLEKLSVSGRKAPGLDVALLQGDGSVDLVVRGEELANLPLTSSQAGVDTLAGRLNRVRFDSRPNASSYALEAALAAYPGTILERLVFVTANGPSASEGFARLAMIKGVSQALDMTVVAKAGACDGWRSAGVTRCAELSERALMSEFQKMLGR